MLRPFRVFSHYVAGQSLALFAGDVLILTASIYVGDWIWVLGLHPVWLGYPPILPKVTVYVLIGVLTFCVAGLYDAGSKQGRKELAVRVITAAVVWGLLFAALSFSMPALRLGRLASFLGFVIATSGVIGLRWISSLQTKATRFRERLLFLGGSAGIEIYSVDPGTGLLLPRGREPVDGLDGLSVHPFGTFLYASLEDGSLRGYAIDPSTGALSDIGLGARGRRLQFARVPATTGRGGA